MNREIKQRCRVNLKKTALLVLLLVTLCNPVVCQEQIPPERPPKNDRSDTRKLPKSISQLPPASSSTKEEQTSNQLAKCKERLKIVIILVSQKSDPEKAVLIKDKLDDLGLKVEGPWPNEDESDKPSTSQLRYFHSDDKECAGLVRGVIKEFLGATVDAIKVVIEQPPKDTLEFYLK